VPVEAELVAGVKYFGRYRAGWIRDAVLLSVGLIRYPGERRGSAESQGARL
jgi:hypothetical protein